MKGEAVSIQDHALGYVPAAGWWDMNGVPCVVLSVCSRCPPASVQTHLRAPPRNFRALEPPANLLCPPSLSVHGSVLSLASSASSTYSSVRPLMSLPLLPPPLPSHIPSDLLRLGNWMGTGNDCLCILPCGPGSGCRGRHLALGALR